MMTVAYLDKKESATYVSLSQRTLDEKRYRGEIPYYLVGRKVLFAISDLNEFMEKRRIAVKASGTPGSVPQCSDHRDGQ